MPTTTSWPIFSAVDILLTAAAASSDGTVEGDGVAGGVGAVLAEVSGEAEMASEGDTAGLGLRVAATDADAEGAGDAELPACEPGN